VCLWPVLAVIEVLPIQLAPAVSIGGGASRVFVLMLVEGVLANVGVANSAP
jgi:hypothetical protein